MPTNRNKKKMDDVIMQNVEIRARNFSGKEGRYNAKGQRNVLVLLPDNIAAAMLEDGWNVKELKPREDDPDGKPTPFLKVKINWNTDPKPRMVVVTSKNKTPLTEEDMLMLDFAKFTNVDIKVNPYQWEVDGDTGVTAYLKSGFFTLDEDELDLKYADIPDSAQSNLVFREDFDNDVFARPDVHFE